MDSLRERIDNQVQNLNGTAAVCVEAALMDESRSLGNWEDGALPQKGICSLQT